MRKKAQQKNGKFTGAEFDAGREAWLAGGGDPNSCPFDS